MTKSAVLVSICLIFIILVDSHVVDDSRRSLGTLNGNNARLQHKCSCIAVRMNTDREQHRQRFNLMAPCQDDSESMVRDSLPIPLVRVEFVKIAASYLIK